MDKAAMSMSINMNMSLGLSLGQDLKIIIKQFKEKSDNTIIGVSFKKRNSVA
jgi:hypothetical protein